MLPRATAPGPHLLTRACAQHAVFPGRGHPLLVIMGPFPRLTLGGHLRLSHRESCYRQKDGAK